MAAKSSIKDVARVLDFPLSESNALAKLVPDRPGTNLNKVISLSPQEIKQNYGQDFENIQKLQAFHANTSSMPGKVLKEALILEGSVRNVGIHAAGIIIAPEDLTNIIDRKSVVKGKSVSVRVDLGGRRIIKKKK